VFHKNGDIATVQLPQARSSGYRASLASHSDLALVIIWSDEPSRHAAASGSVDGAVSITRAAGAYLSKLRTRNDVELLRSPYDARKFMIGRSAIFLMLTSPTPIEGKPAADIACLAADLCEVLVLTYWAGRLEGREGRERSDYLVGRAQSPCRGFGVC
jgi:hypothetical protein